jgi:hypothetical protein
MENARQGRENIQYIIRGMSLSVRALVAAIVLAAAVATAACRGGLLGKSYEYEEDLYLSLDGTATMVVNASLPALVALRGLDIDTSPSTRLDRDRVASLYQSAVTNVARVSPPWRRAGRRFVQVRIDVPDVRRLSEAAPFSWSHYSLSAENGKAVFEQKVGPSALRAGTLKQVGWNGSEIVAFRLHLPSRILWHNSRDLETNQPNDVRRGNILAWEQHLADRLDGVPLEMRVEMDNQSILHRTLWLFLGAFAAAVFVIAGLIWWTMRKAPAEPATSAGP